MDKTLELKKFLFENEIKISKKEAVNLIEEYNQIRYGLFEGDTVYTHKQTLEKMLETKIISIDVFNLLVEEETIL